MKHINQYIKRVLVDPQIRNIPSWNELIYKELFRHPLFAEGDPKKYDFILTRDPEFVRRHVGVPVLVPATLPWEKKPQEDNIVIEKISECVGGGLPVKRLLPLRIIEDVLELVRSCEPGTDERIVGFGAELRYNIQMADRTQDPREREKYMVAARRRFKNLRLELLGGEGQKFMVPLGVPGKYSEMGVFGVYETSLVVKKIEGGSGLTAIADAQARYEAAKRHKNTASLRPSIIYPPLQDGEEVWLVSDQIRGRTVSQILSVLGEEKKKEQDPIKGRKIDNVAAEVIDAHIDSLLYWIEHEQGLPTSPEDIRQSYLARAKESPDLLGRKFTRTRVERILWEKSIDLLLGDLEIPEKTIVARRDAVWDNGLIYLGWVVNGSKYMNPQSVFVEKLLSIPNIRERYFSIDMGAGGDSILMEIAKFRVAPEGEQFEDYVKLHANRVLERAAEIKGFKREDISKATERLVFAYRALRKMVLSARVFPSHAHAEFARLHNAGVLERDVTLAQQLQRYRDDARWCAVYGWREFSKFAYDMMERGEVDFETRGAHLESVIPLIAKGSQRIYLQKGDIGPHGNALLLGRQNAERYIGLLELLERHKGTEEYDRKIKAAAALFVASYLYQFAKDREVKTKG